MTIVLIGPPGSGKTRLGKRVAKALGLPFVDTDKVVVAQYGAIADIFANHGEPHFRALERQAVIDALARDAVVSLGGGAILDPATQADLAVRRVALITVSADAVAARIRGTKRPLVTGIESWVALIEARKETYERLATRTWDTSNRPLDAIAGEIAQWAKEGGE
ncbi:MAG: shikimate kinase [Glaciihabitans sp.]|nr:shikimate kinase [Glaciihabitans sp.]